MILLMSLIFVCLIALYYYLTFNYTYWKKRGVSGPKPILFFGSIKELTLLKVIIGHAFKKIYDQYKNEPYVGIFELRAPALLLRDRELIKDVLVKDFSHFNGRGTVLNESIDPLSANLINLTGQRWRILRTKLTPAFTTARIRNIFIFIIEASKKYKKFVEEYANMEEPVEVRNLAAKFTTEVISECCFGFKTNTLQDEDSEFRRMCKKVINKNIIVIIKQMIRIYMPEIFTALKINLNPRDVTHYIMETVKNMINYRLTHNIIRHDFLQVFMELVNDNDKYNGKQNTKKKNSNDETNQPNLIDDNLIAAQIYIFLMAGFDTASATISFMMYELAINSDIQEKLYKEIEDVLAKHESLSYDAITEMHYLDLVTRETLRKYPPVGVLTRSCNKQYTLRGTKIVVEKGMKVYVPVYAIHHDPEFYPNPTKFDPTRFLNEMGKVSNDCKYLPFGAGPRMCIAVRFAYVQIKAALVALLTDYEILPNLKTCASFEFDTSAAVLTTTAGIWLTLRYRQKFASKNSDQISEEQ